MPKALATFGAGCFWGTQKFFNREFKTAITKSRVGYMGGTTANPDYRGVCTGNTGHAEVLQFEFDDGQVQYADLVRFFFRMHDPTTLNQQGNDRGTQYRSVIFTHSDEQQKAAHAVKEEMKDKWKDIVTEITPAAQAGTFYEGEDYHQDYLDKNPGGYCNHRLRW
eukprot:TRINITY_DN104505_c0_g1_i1.p2 TRINITY_DN104505_c0_g1~~TRINITY_DN104505_c0_g1_i1.p2  ORF type:complete len:165 (-),score=23.61 TRINITY_DN104505_c0_g1_i1:207-701(-)